MKWRKVRVGDFLTRIKDLIPIEKNEEYNLITIKLYHKGVQLRKKESGLKISANKMSRVKAGQFILSGIDARNGAFGIIPDDLDGAVVTNDFWHFDIDESIVSKEYFLWLTSTPFFDDICKKASDGTTNRIRLQAAKFYSQELNVPDIQDQQHVVEELQRRSHKIGLLQDEYKKQHSLLNQLNQSILQEAVQGKLVQQDSDDETASELLQHIKAEIAKSGSREKPLPPITKDELSFDIPKNWVWCRLGMICSKIGSGSTPKGGNYSKSGIPFFRSQNIYNDGLVYDDIKFVTEVVQRQMNGTVVLRNDILLNITGGSMGRCALVPNDFEEGNVSQHVCIIRPLLVNKNYFHKVVLSPYFQKLIFSSTTGAGREGLPKYNLEQFVIPLPPLSEQERIVAEIEKQFAQTKQLKEHITASQKATEQLLKVLLHQAFELKEKGEPVVKSNGKAIELTTAMINWDNLAAAPFEKRAAQLVNNIQNIDWEIALMVACMKKKLGVTYGDVGLQKNVFNTNYLQPIFSKQYDFINSNFGTYSSELKDDLKRNPYLISKKVANNKEVYIVNPKYNKQVLNKLSAPENKEFVKTIDSMLNIYELPFINKETDKIELYNTVLKVAIDKRTTDINVIYQEMKNWKISQPSYKTKAEKYSRSDSEKMLRLLIENGIL